MSQENSGHAPLVETVDPSCCEVIRHANATDHLITECIGCTGGTLCIIALIGAIALLGFGINVWLFDVSLTTDVFSLVGIFIGSLICGLATLFIICCIIGLIISICAECMKYYNTKRQELIQTKSTVPSVGNQEMTETPSSSSPTDSPV